MTLFNKAIHENSIYMRTQFAIIVGLLIVWHVNTQAAILNLREIYRADRTSDAGEQQIRMICQEDTNKSILKCSRSYFSVAHIKPSSDYLDIVDSHGNLTEKGRNAYKTLVADCRKIEDIIKMATSHINPRVADRSADTLRHINLLHETCSSEKAYISFALKKQKKSETTCRVLITRDKEEIEFKHVGEHKWIRTDTQNNLQTLTYEPMFLHKTEDNGIDGQDKVWTYVSEGKGILGEKSESGKAWKYTYESYDSGNSLDYDDDLELSSLKECKRIVFW
jgi:hypothetical protein